ncbi:membrane fusion protein, multidrug efflux system [Methylobacterium sp. 174MFSha1.1]|uniref:efflux RND transporter periplasmic adaptor subunit n=1 Tax=Methylobacterium sp. 174MFSha1.1 TaxID=1502749 RepID=UPI0008F11027|nr:efflux RND transporter periplasmic adaptor subunit [Methylobacterium sp. 174MFSha1.1]SFU95232.1 membrane fusion protein, multidrug efflux system [Methylobacterium sp. 174MFSha1.1]
MRSEQGAGRQKRRRGGWLLALVIVAGAGGAYAWQTRHQPESAKPAVRAPAPVPVTFAQVEQGPFAVVLGSLGTVQAYNTVQVRSRVDGEILKIGFREGQVVKKGDLLAQVDPRQYQAALDQAKAKKAQDEANVKNAKADLERYTKLGDYASRQQTDTQAATVNQLTAQIAADQAAIDNAATQLSYATIQAPIDGVTGFRQIDVGNIVNAAQQTAIVTITQVEPIFVVYTAPEEQLREVTKALAAGPVPVEAWSTDGLTRLSEGRLDLVNNQVDTATGTVRLKASFANKDHALWPGLSVSTKMRTGTIPDAVTVPDDAVQHGPKGLYAFVVDNQRHAHMQAIGVGRSTDGRTQVTKGLTPGQTVIWRGQSRVQEGALVAEAKPAAAEGKPAAQEARQADNAALASSEAR